jgi:hypothetical protein
LYRIPRCALRNLEAELNFALGRPPGHSQPYRLPRAHLPPIGAAAAAEVSASHAGDRSRSSSSSSEPLPPGAALEQAWPRARSAAAKALARGWRRLRARLHSDGAVARASPPDDRASAP